METLSGESRAIHPSLYSMHSISLRLNILLLPGSPLWQVFQTRFLRPHLTLSLDVQVLSSTSHSQEEVVSELC